tara:strand:+ start:164 stop:517 length:354 start_codon:yes stop_codon:yes gene_type:complete
MKIYIKTLVTLLIIANLFGQVNHGQKIWAPDPSLLRNIYVLNENYINHYPDEIEWKTESQVLLIHTMKQAMRKIQKGKYPNQKSEKIVNIIQEYVEIEKQHQEDLKLLKNELRNIVK